MIEASSSLPRKVSLIAALGISLAWAATAGNQTATTPQAPPLDDVERRGLQHTDLDRDLVARSVARTNDLLRDKAVRLVPSWSKDLVPGDPREAVPLHLVDSIADTPAILAAVPRGCRCVFVNPRILKMWSDEQSSGTGRLSIDRDLFLTFILLHEAGHLAKRTDAVDFVEGAVSQLNIDPSKAKAAEEEADEFAADILRQYSRDAPPSMLGLEASRVVTELTTLSWNMQAFRSLDEFGASAVGKASVYFDSGYSHPNLAWRVLRTNHLIFGSAATRSLLEAFEASRQRGTNPEPLYRRETTPPP